MIIIFRKPKLMFSTSKHDVQILNSAIVCIIKFNNFLSSIVPSSQMILYLYRCETQNSVKCVFLSHPSVLLFYNQS